MRILLAASLFLLSKDRVASLAHRSSHSAAGMPRSFQSKSAPFHLAIAGRNIRCAMAFRKSGLACASRSGSSFMMRNSQIVPPSQSSSGMLALSQLRKNSGKQQVNTSSPVDKYPEVSNLHCKNNGQKGRETSISGRTECRNAG